MLIVVLISEVLDLFVKFNIMIECEIYVFFSIYWFVRINMDDVEFILTANIFINIIKNVIVGY